MPISFSRNLRGYGDVRAKLTNLVHNAPKEVLRSMKREFEIEKRESMKRTPVLSGALKDSHVVSEPEILWNGDLHIEIQAGQDLPYAIRVHEDLEMNHPRGGQAKFLESTLKESSGTIAARVANGVDPSKLV